MTPELSDSGIPQRETEILAGYFVDAGNRIADLVLHPKGRSPTAQQLNQARAAAQFVQVDAVVRRLNVQTAGWLGKDETFLKTVHEARGLADRQAERAGVRVEAAVSGSFDVIDERTAAIFARDAARDLTKASTSMGERAKRLLRQTAQEGLDENRINAILAGGVIEGRPAEAIRRLRGELEAVHGAKVRITDRNGDPMEFDAGYYAEMVARTKSREASVKARHERLGELGMDLVTIVGRVSQYFCTAFLGQVFSLSGRHPKYPPYSSLPGGGPPFHPNCTKTTRPFEEALAGDKQLADAEPLDDARQLLGQDTSKAQRMFKDLQLHAQVKDRYANTEQKLFGSGSKAA